MPTDGSQSILFSLRNELGKNAFKIQLNFNNTHGRKYMAFNGQVTIRQIYSNNLSKRIVSEPLPYGALRPLEQESEDTKFSIVLTTFRLPVRQ